MLPGPRPAISTGRSMTATGGVHAYAVGPIAVATVGEIWFVLALATPITTLSVLPLWWGMKGSSCMDASRVPPTISTGHSVTDTAGT